MLKICHAYEIQNLMKEMADKLPKFLFNFAISLKTNGEHFLDF